MPQPKFCHKCGKATIRRALDSFNTETGEPEYELVCPEQRCGHEGHYHEEGRYSWWSMTTRCRHCGVRLSEEGCF